jgi:hypothetical protein
MTNTTLPTLTTAAAVAGPDLFIIRRSGQTSDQQIHARDILAYISAATSGFSVTADQISDATAVGKAVLRASTSAAAIQALGATVVGKALFEASTTAAAQDAIGGTTFGKAVFQATSTAAAQNLLEAGAAGLTIFKAANTAAAQNLLEAGAVGLQVWKTGTTAAALDALGHGTYGKNFIAVSTTAAAQNYLEAGAAGLNIFKATTTAAAQNLLEAGTVGLQVWKTATTAAALDALGHGTYGKNFIAVATTAAAQNLLEAGAVGLTIFKTATTAAAQNILGVVAPGVVTRTQLGTNTTTGNTTMNLTGLATTGYRDLEILLTGISCSTTTRTLIVDLTVGGTALATKIFLPVAGLKIGASGTIAAVLTGGTLPGTGVNQAAASTVDIKIIIDNYSDTSRDFKTFKYYLKSTAEGWEFAMPLGVVVTSGAIDGVACSWNGTGNFDGSSAIVANGLN